MDLNAAKLDAKFGFCPGFFFFFGAYRKKKKLLKERRKQRERVEMKMDLPGVSIADAGDSSMFSLSTISKAKVASITLDRRTLGTCLEESEYIPNSLIFESALFCFNSNVFDHTKPVG